jgi:hypothetical protein
MASLAEVFRILNALKSEGLFHEYAVGGGMAVLFYAEPVRTYDIDVFIFLPAQSGLLLDMTPLYQTLRKKGFSSDAEHILIEGVPVQFLPAYNPLVEEAVREALTHDYEQVPVRVIGPEHLIAIALQTGGRQRQLRAAMVLEQGEVDRTRLRAILKMYGLSSDWLDSEAENGC